MLKGFCYLPSCRAMWTGCAGFKEIVGLAPEPNMFISVVSDSHAHHSTFLYWNNNINDVSMLIPGHGTGLDLVFTWASKRSAQTNVHSLREQPSDHHSLCGPYHTVEPVRTLSRSQRDRPSTDTLLPLRTLSIVFVYCWCYVWQTHMTFEKVQEVQQNWVVC